MIFSSPAPQFGHPILAATDTGPQGPKAPTWTDSFRIMVGISFSSPLVAGTVGLLVSAQGGLSPALVRAALQSTARPFPTTGGDNGSDPTRVQQCSPPSANVKQLQCCCNTSVCGAGMLDAASAVSAVATLRAAPWLKTAAPQAGAVLELDGAGSSTPAGRSKVVPQGPHAHAPAPTRPWACSPSMLQPATAAPAAPMPLPPDAAAVPRRAARSRRRAELSS